MKRTEQEWLAWANENLPPSLVATYRQNVEWVKAWCRLHAWRPTARAAVRA